jgi:hypothetical protein
VWAIAPSSANFCWTGAVSKTGNGTGTSLGPIAPAKILGVDLIIAVIVGGGAMGLPSVDPAPSVFDIFLKFDKTADHKRPV